MATQATPATPEAELGGRRELSRSWRDRIAGYGLSLPAIALLLVFFLLPIYFIVRFSLGLERFARTEAAAELTGELAGFSTSLWRDFLGAGVDLKGNLRSDQRSCP